MPQQAINEQTLAAALGRSEPLASLLQRMRESQARHALVSGLLPEGLRSDVRAGPLDDTSWVLLVSHAAGAAKLRQLLPDLQAALLAAGRGSCTIRIKVQPKG